MSLVAPRTWEGNDMATRANAWREHGTMMATNCHIIAVRAPWVGGCLPCHVRSCQYHVHVLSCDHVALAMSACACRDIPKGNAISWQTATMRLPCPCHVLAWIYHAVARAWQSYGAVLTCACNAIVACSRAMAMRAYHGQAMSPVGRVPLPVTR